MGPHHGAVVPKDHNWYSGTMTEPEEAPTDVQLKIRIPDDLLNEVDKRIALMRAKGKIVSRSQWFENMTRWVVFQLPHAAVKADLIKAWPNMPEESLFEESRSL